jgi:hypothetical protein
MVTQLYLKNLPFNLEVGNLQTKLDFALNDSPVQTGTAKIGAISLPANREREGISGFGFVSIFTGSLTEDESIEALFGIDIDGRKLHVEKYVAKERR